MRGKTPRLFRGYTLVELLCGIAIIGLLAALLVPAAVTARRRAQASACLSNIKQLNLAILSYSQDYDGNFPAATSATFQGGKTPPTPSGFWYEAISAYTGGHQFICPTRWVPAAHQDKPYSCGYALNWELNEASRNGHSEFFTGKSESALRTQASVVTVFDARAGVVALYHPDTLRDLDGIVSHNMRAEMDGQTGGGVRHGGGGNYGFADGHARWLRPFDFVIQCDGTKPCFKP